MRSVLAFFLSCVLAFTVSGGVLVTSGCNSASLLNKVEDFQPVVLDALNLFCSIKPNETVCSTTWLAKINADYTTATQLWAAYLKAMAAGTATVAAYNLLNAAFEVYENDANQIFQLIPQLNNPTISAIVASAEVLLAAIEVMFPNPPAGATPKSRIFATQAIGRTSYNKAWLSAWVKDFNMKVNTAKKLYPNVQLSTVSARHLNFGGVAIGW